MKSNKKLDQIFRDKLQGVEITPPEEVWKNISPHLPEKKKRKLLPFWYQLGGAAAAIVIIFYLFNNNNTPISNNEITENDYLIQKPNFQINITSEGFLEMMSSSSQFLNTAVIDTKIEFMKAQLLSGTNAETDINPASTKNFIGSGEITITDISEESGKTKTVQNKPLDHNNFSDGVRQTSENFSAIAAVSKEETEENDLQKIASAKNSEKEILIKEAGSKRFSVTPTAAAVYFDTGKGNTLDNQFAGKNGSGEISMSYGLNLAYQVSEKIKIRSGLNSVNLSYSTKNIDYESARSSSTITTQENAIIQTSSVNGSLNQDFSFLEIPMEIEYILIDKKLGLNLIGGASTFFLEENRIVLESLNSTTEIGAANNINKTSFSANLGIGVNYDISSQFRFNLEPIFKYQIETFKGSSNLKSYYFGIYSGLSFKF